MFVHELRAQRAELADDAKSIHQTISELDAKITVGRKTGADVAALLAEKKKYGLLFEDVCKGITEKGDEIARVLLLEDIERKTAVEAVNQPDATRVAAQAKHDIYTHKDAAEARGLITNKGLAIAGAIRLFAGAGGNAAAACASAEKAYGAQHPVTKALVTSVGSSGGFIVPPDQATEIIEVLRPQTAVRSANPRTIPMPRGTMTLPSQTAAASAAYAGEAQKINASQQTFGQIVASFKKLVALVPGSNDLLRYSEPAADAVIRDDLTKVLALREDLAFLVGDGTQYTPRGFLSFANQYAAATGGSAGTFLSAANSTYAVGGNFITSTESYTQASVANELAGAVNRLDVALVPDMRRMWFMHPRIYNYLYNLLNSLGLYVYRAEMDKGTLLGYPMAKRSTQIPANIYDTNGANTNASFVILAEMTEAMIFDAMSMELFVSREGSYTDGSGTQQNLVANDEFLIRAIMEHDFQLRHPASVAVIQGVLWAPAIQ